MIHEATVWCPVCKTVAYELYREPLRENVFAYVRKPETENYKTCEKGHNLERK